MTTIKNRIALLAGSLALMFAGTSCTNFRTAEQNSAATGGLIGAGAGAILSDDPVKGAAVGGALGAGSGYLYEKVR